MVPTAPRNRFAAPSSEVARALNGALGMLQAFRALEPTMPTAYAAGFLAVALKPGLGVNHYASQLDMLGPVMSRILLEIGQKSRKDDHEGLQLVDSVTHPDDLRAKQYFLTPKGEKLLGKILAALGVKP